MESLINPSGINESCCYGDIRKADTTDLKDREKALEKRVTRAEGGRDGSDGKEGF